MMKKLLAQRRDLSAVFAANDVTSQASWRRNL